MIRGLYTAASGMLAQQLANDNTADNIANLNTVGFKRRSTTHRGFEPMAIQRVQEKQERSPVIGQLTPGVEVHATAIHFSQGSLRQTGNPLDLALSGDGFLVVQLPNGQEAYTRNGSLKVDDSGNLTTHDGLPVLGENGPIVINGPVMDLTVTERGRLELRNQGEVGQLRLVTFNDNDLMEKQGNSLFVGGNPQAQPQPAGPRLTIQQGYLEQSNVNVVWEMMSSISGVRYYEALQKAIQQQNATLGKVVNEVGKG